MSSTPVPKPDPNNFFGGSSSGKPPVATATATPTPDPLSKLSDTELRQRYEAKLVDEETLIRLFGPTRTDAILTRKLTSTDLAEIANLKARAAAAVAAGKPATAAAAATTQAAPTDLAGINWLGAHSNVTEPGIWPGATQGRATASGGAAAAAPKKTLIQEWIDRNAPGSKEGRQFTGENGTRWLEIVGPDGSRNFVALEPRNYADNAANRAAGLVGKFAQWEPTEAPTGRRAAIPTGIPAGFGGEDFKTVGDVRQFFRNMGGQDNGTGDFGFRPNEAGYDPYATKDRFSPIGSPLQAGTISGVPVAEGGRPIIGNVALPLPANAPSTRGQSAGLPFNPQAGLEAAGLPFTNRLYPDIALASAAMRDPNSADFAATLNNINPSGSSSGVSRVVRDPTSGQLMGSGTVGFFEPAMAALEALNQQGFNVTGNSAATVADRAQAARVAQLTGLPPRPIEEDPFPVQAFARGGRFTTDEPLLMVGADSGIPHALAGEQGPEKITITPQTPQMDEGYAPGIGNMGSRRGAQDTPLQGTGQMAFGRYFSNAGSGEGYPEVGGKEWWQFMAEDELRRSGIKQGPQRTGWVYNVEKKNWEFIPPFKDAAPGLSSILAKPALGGV